MIEQLPSRCWAVDRDAEPAAHFRTRAEAKDENQYQAENGFAAAAPVHLPDRCITITCECGEYLLAEDDRTASTHFPSMADAHGYALARGLPLSDDGVLSCSLAHPELEPEESLHIGRDWEGTFLEGRCPCPKAACGLVEASTVSPECREHSATAQKSIRQMHSSAHCFPAESNPRVPVSAPHGIAHPSKGTAR